jgi:carbamate kinase
VPRVQRGFGSLYPEDIERMTASEAKAMIKKGEFGAGSMGPKVQAAVNFVENGGVQAIIADLDDASAALDGDAGTVVTAG